MNANERKELKVGDRVGFGHYHRFTLLGKGFGTVTKINGHGHIEVTIKPADTMPRLIKVFDKNGDERGRGEYGDRLMNAADLEKHLADEKEAHDRREAVRNLERALADLRSGCGDYTITAMDKADLIALINAIPASPSNAIPASPSF